MTLSADLVRILVCPDTRQPLTLAEPALVEQLNRAIAAGQVKNKGQQPVTAQLSGALVRQDRQLAYPIVDDIPMLLVDESIELASLQP